MVIYGRMDWHTCRLVGDDEVFAVKQDAGLPVKVCNRETFRLQMDTNILPASDRAVGSDSLAFVVDRSERHEALRFAPIQTERFKTVEQRPFLLDSAVADASLCSRC